MQDMDTVAMEGRLIGTRKSSVECCYYHWPLVTHTYSKAPQFLHCSSYLYKSSAVVKMGDCGHNRHGPKRGGLLCPFQGGRGGQLGLRITQCGLGRGLLRYQVASSSIQPFGHNRQGPKTGGCAPFSGDLGLHLTQCRLNRGLPPYQAESWPIQPLGHNRH